MSYIEKNLEESFMKNVIGLLLSLSLTTAFASNSESVAEVKKFAANIIISIKDNGVGFDFQEKYHDKKSLGLKTMFERSKFLKGQMKVVSTKENGSQIEFKFPIQ